MSLPPSPDPHPDDDATGETPHHSSGEPAPDETPGAPAATESPGARPLPEASAELSADALIHREKPAPTRGWRRALFTMSRGYLNPGESRIELRRQELETTVRRATLPDAPQAITVLGTQEGAGATTTALALGAALAKQRGDQSIVLDADARHPPLTERMPPQAPSQSGLGELLHNPGDVTRYSDFAAHTAQATTGLDLLPSHPGELDSAVLSAADFQLLADVAERFYSLHLVDAGSDIMQPAVPAILARSDQLVLATPPSRDGAVSAANVLDEVGDLGYTRLAETSLVTLTRAPAGTGEPSELDDIQEQLTRRCRNALRIPNDPHLEAHGAVDPDQMRVSSVIGYLELAVAVLTALPRRG